MKPVIYVNSDLSKAYYDEGFFTKIKDRFRINLEGESFIKELDLKVAHVKLPPNFNPEAYKRNLALTSKFMKRLSPELAPKTHRCLDYEFLSDFQKRLFAYGVSNSIQLLLRINNKSIKSSCILVYDAADVINYNILLELSKCCRYLILLSTNLKRLDEIRDYLTANFGISPIITSDYAYAALKCDFVVSSRDIEVDKPIWYINNLFTPAASKATAINDISFAVPWENNGLEYSFELLGAILGQMQEKDVGAALKYNGIYLDKIKFNDEVMA